MSTDRTKQIRVSESLHARIEDEKEPDETMGEALERMVGAFSLHSWATEEWDDVSEDVRSEAAETLRSIDEEDDFAEVEDDIPT